MGLISRVSSRTYRNFISKNFKKANFYFKMKTINSSLECGVKEFEGVKLIVKGQKVTVIGPRGTLQKDLSHLKVELKKTGPQTVLITKWWATNRGTAALKTVASHLKNMAIGVTSGFRYKMRTVYAHLPINMVVGDNGKSVNIKNFLGERKLRLVNYLDGVYVSAKCQIKADNELLGITDE